MVVKTEPTWAEVTEKKQKKNDDSKTWKGEIDGESIFGKVEDFREVVTKDGRTVHVLNLYNDVLNQSYTVWCRGMLLRKLEAAGVATDMMVKIEFVGLKPLATDPDRSFRSYKVYVAEVQ
jgi:hypothetical protein